MVKVTVHRQTRLGSVEFFGIPLRVENPSEPLEVETQRIVLDPPGVVRDTVVLAIQANLTLGQEQGEIEGVRWEKQLAAIL